MLRVFMLLLPTLIPSWRFFKTVAPSPRIEWRLIRERNAGQWQEDRPRPARVGLWQMFGRLFWNAGWNEQLYLVSLSERMIVDPSEHALQNILRLVAPSLPAHEPGDMMQVRLVFLARDGTQLVKAVAYESDPCPVSEHRS